ncbi:MAG: rRNA maturation RNase YbeY [Planctomycetes bacterium]|nr:rRNA maturation RNase YbeY [Planctomycetota bacterium]
MSEVTQAHDDRRACAVQVLGSGLIDRAVVDWLQDRLVALRGMAAPAIRRFTVQLVNDGVMSQLHARHMNDPTTTDVLTFADGNEVDVAVCVDEARRRAAELGHDLSRELLLYSLHGLLHAVGFDDREPSDFERMHAEEDRLLAAIGIAATFAPKGGPA